MSLLHLFRKANTIIFCKKIPFFLTFCKLKQLLSTTLHPDDEILQLKHRQKMLQFAIPLQFTDSHFINKIIFDEMNHNKKKKKIYGKYYRIFSMESAEFLFATVGEFVQWFLEHNFPENNLRKSEGNPLINHLMDSKAFFNFHIFITLCTYAIPVHNIIGW